MKRSVEDVAGKHVDLAVIGAGMHGATVAAFAASCGLSVALLDRGDFCGATSANSLKIVHGGLRYLQHLDLPRIRESIASRRWMLATFPHLVKPLACIMPTTGYGVRGRLAMTLGLAANEMLSCTRNRGVNKACHLKRGKVISREATAQIISDVQRDSITGGAVWYDALALNTERVVLELVHSLAARTGVPLNYVQVEDVQPQKSAVTLQCTDLQTDAGFTFSATGVINTTGPWFEQFGSLPQQEQSEQQGWSRAVNIVVRPRLFADYAVGLEGGSSFIDKDAVIQKGKRLFFFVPWRGRTMIGTNYTPHPDPDIQPTLTRAELESMLSEINQIYPAAGLTYDDICNYHVGLVPSRQIDNGGPFDVQLDKKEVVLDHSVPGQGHVISVKTVKYTTAYSIALELMDLLAQKGMVDKKQVNKVKNTIMPPVDQSKDAPSEALELRYGRQAPAVRALLRQEEVVNKEQQQNTLITPCEVRYAVQKEMACHLDDVLFRRSGVATLGPIPLKQVESAAAIMAEELGWADEQQEEEISRVLAHFAPLSITNS